MRTTARGFTLIELLVSLTGGLFVSIAVFALARDASRFYQREGRLANATLAGLVGFDRLRADIARAGFLSSPNIQADPSVCARPTNPAMLADLASVQITDGGEADDLNPDALLLAGSYASADEFPIRTVDQPAMDGSVIIYLQSGSPALARLGYNLDTSQEARRRVLSEVFATDRVLRIVDNEGRQHYGIIGDTDVTPDGLQPTVTLTDAAPLQFRGGTTQLCGLKGLETGASVNVVNFIRYDVRNLRDNADYAGLYDISGNDPFDADRTELVRSEVSPVDGSTLFEELAAEYTVDFQLEVTAVTNNPPQDPVVGHITEATSFSTFTDPPSALAQPQRVRALRVRIAVRSREADREADISTAPGSLYRVGLGADGGGPFARVRTFQADIMLNNHTRVQW